jgi:hypothetical protein
MSTILTIQLMKSELQLTTEEAREILPKESPSVIKYQMALVRKTRENVQY